MPDLHGMLADAHRVMAGPVGQELTASTPRIGRYFHGCPAVLAPVIAEVGLRPMTDYVHLTASEGMAWAFGAWGAGLTMGSGVELPLADLEPLGGPVGETVVRALREGPNVAAIAVVSPPTTMQLEECASNTACPLLPWETLPRSAPYYRTDQPIDPRWIESWRLYRIPQLLEPGMLAQMHGRADDIAHEYPRGRALLEDLDPGPIGATIPNARRLVAAVLDAAGVAAELADHGVPHWTRVAARGLDLHPDADPTVLLLFALLHDARRRHDGNDQGHGARGADLARELNGGVFTLPERALELLADACSTHSDGLVSDNATVGAAWDSDRLDLGRYAHRPVPELMSTPRGRELAARPPEPLSCSLVDVLASYARAVASWPDPGPVEPGAALGSRDPGLVTSANRDLT